MIRKLFRASPWVIAAVAMIGFAASFSELQRMRGRFGEVTRHNFHDHQDVRKSIIESALAEASDPIVVIGDSITEVAKLPEAIGGYPVVNAGIGGATTGDFLALAPRILEGLNPLLIAVALGTNDAGSSSSEIRQNYAALLRLLKAFSPRLIAIGVPPQANAQRINAEIEAAAVAEGVPFLRQELPDGTRRTDLIHLNAAGYRIWTPRLIAAISERVSQQAAVR